MNNQTYAEEQLALYYKNRTSKERLSFYILFPLIHFVKGLSPFLILVVSPSSLSEASPRNTRRSSMTGNSWICQHLSPQAMQEVGPEEVKPGAQITEDDDIAEAIRNLAQSTWSHPSCSLSMMKKEYGGVVGPDLRSMGSTTCAWLMRRYFRWFRPRTHHGRSMRSLRKWVLCRRPISKKILESCGMTNVLFLWQAADIIRGNRTWDLSPPSRPELVATLRPSVQLIRSRRKECKRHLV